MIDCDPRKVFGVYEIRNLETGDVYIGSCRSSFHRRWSQHRLHLRKSMHHSRYLQRAWDKYGEGAFKFSVLEVVPNTSDLIAIEQYWIDQWLGAHLRDTLYNMSLTARVGDSGEWTDARRAAQAEQARVNSNLRYQNPQARAEQVERLAAIRNDPQVQQWRRDNLRKALQRPEYREGKSQNSLARWEDPEQRQRMSEGIKRAKNEPESRARHSAAMKELRRAQPERFASGERQGFAKLSKDQVRTIRDLYTTGDYSQSALARMFGVGHGAVHDIVRNKTWRGR